MARNAQVVEGGAMSAPPTALVPAGSMTDEARRNYERGPASGVCGWHAGSTFHCMRDYGHSGDHEVVDLGTPRMFAELPGLEPVNKFHSGNREDGRHYWLTPPDLYARLDAEFHFDFDPCPYPLPDGFDGLTCEWGKSNYVNPPFGSIIHAGRKKGPTAWVRKAIDEYRKGKLVVLVYPVDKWVLLLLDVLGARVRNLGDVRWYSIEDGQPGPGTGRHIACFVLDPRNPA